MISYDKIWKYLDDNKIGKYEFKNKCGLSGQTYANMLSNKHINTKTLEQICKCMNLNPDDIFEFYEESE